MKLSILTTILLAGASSFAGSTERVERLLSSGVYPLTLSLNNKTVRCLVGDYGSSSLKISVSELRGYTQFRQTTKGETEPCINAGACEQPGIPGFKVEDIIRTEKPTEKVKVSVKLSEILEIDHENKTCTRSLVEAVKTKVRGIPFFHSDGANLGALNYEICLQMKESK